MATGALNAQGVWIYGEDDSETTFSALLNKLGTSVSSNMKGRIAQIVHSSTSTPVTSSTTTYVNTGLSASITPTSSTSKIIILVNQNGILKSGAGDTYMNMRLLRDSTVIQQVDNVAAAMVPIPSVLGIGGLGASVVETSGSTTARTYKTMFMSAGNVASIIVQQLNSTSSITLIEVTA